MSGQNDTLAPGKRPKWESDPIVAVAASTLTATSPGRPVIDIKPDDGAPAFLAASTNPHSAGRYPLGRIFTVGDEATIRESDLISGVEVRIYALRVTLVDTEAGRIEINNGNYVADLMGNYLKTEDAVFSVPLQFAPAELFVGKKWRAAFRRNDKFGPSSTYIDFHIPRREKIVVPAGEFNAFRLEGEGWNTGGPRIERVHWLVPGLNFEIKQERIVRLRTGHYFAADRRELVSLRQQAIGL
jgi:hypothetical protein